MIGPAVFILWNIFNLFYFFFLIIGRISKTELIKINLFELIYANYILYKYTYLYCMFIICIHTASHPHRHRMSKTDEEKKAGVKQSMFYLCRARGFQGDFFFLQKVWLEAERSSGRQRAGKKAKQQLEHNIQNIHIFYTLHSLHSSHRSPATEHTDRVRWCAVYLKVHRAIWWCSVAFIPHVYNIYICVYLYNDSGCGRNYWHFTVCGRNLWLRAVLVCGGLLSLSLHIHSPGSAIYLSFQPSQLNDADRQIKCILIKTTARI